MASSFCIHYIIYISWAETSSENENKCTDFSQIEIFYAKTLLNCAALFQRFSLGGVLLTSGILSSASYVEGRGKPSTWLPRQKLAEERKQAEVECLTKFNLLEKSHGSITREMWIWQNSKLQILIHHFNINYPKK